MPILFLDFDGVLHPEHCHESRHFCCMSILEDALRQVPECKLVITSTWRLERPLDTLRQRFARDIAARIAGITPTLMAVQLPVVKRRKLSGSRWGLHGSRFPI